MNFKLQNENQIITTKKYVTMLLFFFLKKEEPQIFRNYVKFIKYWENLGLVTEIEITKFFLSR